MLGAEQERRMAASPTTDEKARMALRIFQHFGTRPRDTLRGDNFVGFATRHGWENADVVEGLVIGKSLGWFEDGPNDSFRLTAAGFAAF
jgi:hypothetical protein